MNDTDSQERPRRRRGSRFVHADADIEPLQFTPDNSQSPAKTHTNNAKESLSRPTVHERTRLQEFTGPVDNHLVLRGSTINEVTPVIGRRVTELTSRDIQEKMFLRGMLRQTTRQDDVIATQPLSLSVSRASIDDNQLTSSREVLSFAQVPDSQVLGVTYYRTAAPVGLPSALELTHAKVPQQQTPTSPKKRAPLGKISDTHIPQRRGSRNKNDGNHEAVTFLQNPLARPGNVIESVDKNMVKLKLSKAKTMELEKKGRNRNANRKSRTIDKNAGGSKGSEDHINCECGDEKFEEDMICCDNCDEWQHTDCYGFTSAKDTRIPDYHMCYSCLLGKNEGKLLEEMRNTALFRRALRTIWRQGSFPSSNKVFANKLGISCCLHFPSS